MLNSIRFLYLVLIIAGFQLAVLAQEKASVVKKLSKGADVILTGKVTQKKSSWNEAKTRIYTKTTLEVEEYLKGKKSDNHVDIITPGGEVGDIGELYTHLPRFEENEEVLVFLKRDEKNTGYKVFKGEEGKIKVLSDSKTKEKITPSNLRIEDLKSKIKSYIDEQ
jgi:hypothetical protein